MSELRQRRPIARRIFSREVVKVPRALARRTGLELERCQYALRPTRPPEQALRRALRPGLDTGTAVARFRAREGRAFFFERDQVGAILATLERDVPRWRERVLADADRICAHVVRLLGADEVDLGRSIPWHEDVLNDFAWNPRTFYKQVPVPYDRADLKVPWELARCQHLATLGMAYTASGDERYAREVVAQIDDFIAANRPGYGVNWMSTMDVAIRAANWLWAVELVADSDAVTDEFLTTFLASLVTHGRHIAENVSVYDGGVTTNHTVADYAGLTYLGLMLPDIAAAEGWADAGIGGLAACMERHVSADGVDYENSISYHRLVTEMYLDALVLADRNGRAFPAAYRESLERMVEFVLHYTRPDGLAPLVGDSDDGRWHLLADYFGWEPRDHRHLMGVAAHVFGREDFAAAAAGCPAAVEEAAWITGPDAADALGSAVSSPAVGSRAFAEGGRYVMRHGDSHALVSTDEVGTGGFGNHKHNDILGFELCLGGRPVAVDCGTYLYLRDRQMRDALRSTRAHNTLVIDGREQNEMTDTFRMRRIARVQVHDWQTGPDRDVLDASYELGDEPGSVRHRRRIGFLKDRAAWLVVDTIDGPGEHDVESFLHLAPGFSVAEGAGEANRRAPDLTRVIAAVGGDAPLRAHSEAALLCSDDHGGVLVVPVNWDGVAVESGWVAPRYGRRESAPVIKLGARLGAGADVGYLILPA